MESSVEAKVSLPWEVTCEIACQALIWKCSFEQAVSMIVNKYRGAIGGTDG